MKRYLQRILLLSLLLFSLYPADVEAQPQGAPLSISGKKLLVGVTHDPPYLVKGKGGEWTGINVDVWKSVAQTIRADYEFRELTFEELIESLEKRRIDISIEAFFVLAERLEMMDYTFSFGNTRLAVATLPEKIHHPWWTAVQIFFSWGTLKIVMGLCLVLVILGTIFWLIERNHNPDHFGGGKIRGIGSGIYWVGSTLTSGVCFGVALKSLPARILGLLWMMACAIALSALIASLTSALSANRSLVELVSEDTLRHMHLGGIKGSGETFALINMGGKFMLFGEEEAALKAVLHGNIDGFLYDEITLHYYRDNDYKDKISVYPTGIRRFSFAFGLPKDSPLRTKVNYALISLMEKPEWAFILKRYGLKENFEAIEAPQMQKGKRS